ncbi:MAG: hypothetical protein U0V75_14525 [Ferruginibacter sp.]
MEDVEIINLWKSKDKNMDAIIQLNRENAAELLKVKAHSLLSSMKPVKILGIVFAILWTAVAGTLVIKLFMFHYNDVSPFFLYSAALQVILTVMALVIYLFQAITINRVNIDGSVIEIQEKIARLKYTTLAAVRITILQLPLWTIFYWNSAMFENAHWVLWMLQVDVTLLCTILALWLFFNIRYKNRNKRWFRFFFNSKEWAPLMKAMELLDQSKDYK